MAKDVSPRSAHSPGGLRARLRRAEQLHHLLRRRLRLLPELGGQTSGELEVVLRVPVVRRGLDRLAELLFGAAQPAESRVRLLFHERFLEERAARPEARRRRDRRLLREIDDLVVALQAVERQQMVADDPRVLAGGELAQRRQRVEARLRELVLAERLIETAVSEGLIGGGDVRGPSGVADEAQTGDQQERYDCGYESFRHLRSGAPL